MEPTNDDHAHADRPRPSAGGERMNYQILQGDCLETLRTLPAGSVQTCVTSPPYYGLRDYGHEGQIGLEETPEAYVAKLVDVFREVRRVLHPTGTCWINLGDSYASASKGSGGPSDKQLSNAGSRYEARKFNHGVKEKDLLGIPWLVAFALRADGWWLRSDIIWHKPNPMPESVTDRPTKAHEYIFLLSKSAQYYYDADAIAEQRTDPEYRERGKIRPRPETAAQIGKGFEIRGGLHNQVGGRATRNRRSVWTVPTRSYKGAHFATFPPDLIEPCILAGSSAHGCCADCGAPWVRVVERTNDSNWQERKQNGANSGSLTNGHNASHGRGVTHDLPARESITLGWQPTCTCNADIVPCTVLDPFNGSGTTGAVSLKHGRQYIGCELNPAYIELAHDRIRKSQPMLLDIYARAEVAR